MVALLGLTCIAYAPAFSAGFIWDDPDYVVLNGTLRSFRGLADIWLNPFASPQYYPLVFTTFWLEFHLWGLDPSGYHTVNILLQAANAVLLWTFLRRIEVPGAWLAAAIFAVHPVHVESVAWITERKNVLSGFFYLAAAIVYFDWLSRRDQPEAQKKNRWYVLALVLFAFALLSKTVTCSFPAAVLLVVWWRRGWIDLKRDVLPLVPFFAIGTISAIVTPMLERVHVGAMGAEWDYSFVERCLIASRALWFYLGKLLWPVNLAFIYPKWTIDPARPLQWLFPIAAIALIALLIALRKRLGRGPLVAMLFFGGTLLPALGFINIYPMRYSFVADHFQYLASLGPIVLIAAALWRYVKPRPAAAIALLPLVVLTFMQSRHYASAEALWRDTLAKNRHSWMVHTNLANALADQGRFEAAFDHYATAARLAPDLPETHWNLGAALERRGDYDAAVAELDRATMLDPTFPAPYYVRGNILFKQGKVEEAREETEEALKYAPQFADAHYLLGRIAEQQNRAEDAIEHYTIAVQNSFGNADAHYNLANLLLSRGRFDEALIHYSQAVRIRPDWAEAHTNLGATLLQLNRVEEAIVAFETALRIDPTLAAAQQNLARARLLRRSR